MRGQPTAQGAGHDRQDGVVDRRTTRRLGTVMERAELDLRERHLAAPADAPVEGGANP